MHTEYLLNKRKGQTAFFQKGTRFFSGLPGTGREKLIKQKTRDKRSIL